LHDDAHLALGRSRDREQPRMVRLALLYQRTSRSGVMYFSGYLGDAQLLMFRGPDTPEGQATWKLLAQERDPERRPGRQGQFSYQRPSPPRPPERRSDPWAPDDDDSDPL
jgi:hypothetical protein